MPASSNPTLTSKRVRTWAMIEGIGSDTASLVASASFRMCADELDRQAATITHLATLLDGVLADDPQAIRDAAQWLTVNRPDVTGGDTVGVRWLDTDDGGEG